MTMIGGIRSSLTLLIAAALLAPVPGHAEGDEGKALYEKQCKICHMIGGEGGKMADKGGALDGVGAKHDATWIKAYLQDPKAKLPESKMPPSAWHSGRPRWQPRRRPSPLRTSAG